MTTELNLNAFEFKTIVGTKRVASLDKKQTSRFLKYGYHLFRKAFHPKIGRSVHQSAPTDEKPISVQCLSSQISPLDNAILGL